MAVPYTYVLVDPLSGRVMDEVPMINVKYDVLINGAGQFTGEIPIGGTGRTFDQLMGETRPWHALVYAVRGNLIPYVGIITARGYDSDSRRLAVTAQGLWAYYRRRIISWDALFTNVDQVTVVSSLLTRAGQETSGALANLQLDLPASTGRLRTRGWYGYERKNLGEAIDQLAAVIDGFDFYFDGAMVSGVPTPRFHIGYPRWGRIGVASPLQLELPGNLSKFTFTDDGTDSANRVYAIGAGQGPSQLQQTVTDGDSIDPNAGGWPLIEAVQSMFDVKESLTLLGHAQEYLANKTNAARVWRLQGYVSDELPIGVWTPGDDMLVRLRDATAFPSGTDLTLRCVGASISVGDGNAPEQITYVATETF